MLLALKMLFCQGYYKHTFFMNSYNFVFFGFFNLTFLFLDEHCRANCNKKTIVYFRLIYEQYILYVFLNI